MIYLINLFFFLIISNSSFAFENKTNEILFRINNKVFTYIDLEERKEYIALINNFVKSEFSESENEEILEDYISSLIFYEYYIQNKKSYKKLEDEVNLIFEKKFKNNKLTNQIKINNFNFKFNTNIDLIRKKIIEEVLNSKKSSLLQEPNKLDLLYNYNLQYIIVRENLIDKELIKDIDDKEEFISLKNYLKKNKIDFFYKEEDINNNSIISKKIKNIIDQNIQIYKNNENGYVNLISINKNLESYEGVFVKLINFISSTPFEKKDLQCNNLNETIDVNKTVFKEYEYSKLNNNIKNNLKSINDYILFINSEEYNYIVLCDLTYDEKIFKNINFNKNVNSLVNKIEQQFLKKYRNEYKFSKIK